MIHGYSIIDYIGPIEAGCWPHNSSYLAADEISDKEKETIDSFCRKILNEA